MNDRGFLAVYLLLASFGVLILVTLYLFNQTEYLLISVVAEVLILLNVFLWRWLSKTSFFQRLVAQPLLLFGFYCLKFSVIILILYIVAKL